MSFVVRRNVVVRPVELTLRLESWSKELGMSMAAGLTWNLKGLPAMSVYVPFTTDAHVTRIV